MKNKKVPNLNTFKRNDSVEGETIEMKVRRIVEQKEPITDGAPIIYTERNQGVMPEYNIRSDRFDIALDAMDKISKSRIAKREEFYKEESTESSQSEASSKENTTE